MGVLNSKAIVINTIKYSETSLIVKLFSEDKGMLSFIQKGILSSKKGKIKAAYFVPLTQLLIASQLKENRDLHILKEVSVINPYETNHSNVVKQSIIFFLAEVLSKSIKEEEQNKALYQFLETSLLWLDTNDKIANFHLFFLLNLTRYLGFYPDISRIDSSYYFSLIEGEFVDFTHEKNLLEGKSLYLFKKLLGMNFDAIESVLFSKKERKELLTLLTNYYEIHLEGFSKPNSLQVLETVFS